MAYMNQEKKKVIAAKLKPVLKKYGVKGSLSVRNHMSIVLNVKSGKIDFFNDYGDVEDAKKFGIQVNPYWFEWEEYVASMGPRFYGPDFDDESGPWYWELK
jgi:hypothetical protein